MYAKLFKRLIDFSLSLIASIVISPIIIILSVVGAVALKGNPFFTQLRPGKNEKIFKLLKFRTMTNEKDREGKLLPDDKRLVPYGRFLRSTSLDELPELFNILLGQMSIIGPRPLLVADMLFMTDDQRRRHTVRPGLTGLAQCNGRNNITWEKKLDYDLTYISKITFIGDLKILFKTVFKVFSREGINRDGMDTDMDLGDWLLTNGDIAESVYMEIQAEAKKLLGV